MRSLLDEKQRQIQELQSRFKALEDTYKKIKKKNDNRVTKRKKKLPSDSGNEGMLVRARSTSAADSKKPLDVSNLCRAQSNRPRSASDAGVSPGRTQRKHKRRIILRGKKKKDDGKKDDEKSEGSTSDEKS